MWYNIFISQLPNTKTERMTMASKSKWIYQCRECGFESAKWMGKCPSCGEWNTFEEVVKEASAPQKAPSAGTRVSRPTPINEISMQEESRYHTGLSELDRVLGGGIVKGSLILISGDPGIGKSTMLLQICKHLGGKPAHSLCVWGGISPAD